MQKKRTKYGKILTKSWQQTGDKRWSVSWEETGKKVRISSKFSTRSTTLASFFLKPSMMSILGYWIVAYAPLFIVFVCLSAEQKKNWINKGKKRIGAHKSVPLSTLSQCKNVLMHLKCALMRWMAEISSTVLLQSSRQPKNF